MNVHTNKQLTGIITPLDEVPSALSASRFKRVSPLAALVILIGTVLLIGYGLLRGQEPFFDETFQRDPSHTDAGMYRAIIQRLRNGESYYAVAGDELRSRGYATRPFVNWRPPFLAWLLAVLPNPAWGKWILAGIASVAWVLWVILFYQAGNHWRTMLIAFLLYASIPAARAELCSYFHETWAGLIILLSLALHGKNHWILAAVTGSAALLLRELSLPFVLVMFGCAVWERKWQEGSLWALGLLTFALFLIIHASIVTPLIMEADLTNAWLRCGGWPFVLATANCNPWLLLLFFFFFKGISAIMLPLALVGLAGWRGELGNRVALTVTAYVLLCMVAGRSDNTYWGLLYASLLLFGWVMAPAAFHDLWNAARRVSYSEFPLFNRSRQEQ